MKVGNIQTEIVVLSDLGSGIRQQFKSVLVIGAAEGFIEKQKGCLALG